MPSILIVCEGNVCRSPYVEGVLRDRLHAAGIQDLVVRSAGTRARPGLPMAERSVSALVNAGIGPTAFTSSPLDARQIRSSDLVLTLERAHRADLLDLVPSALRKTFTIREFHRLVGPLVTAGRQTRPDLGREEAWRQLPALLTENRRATVDDPADDDVADPVRRDSEEYAEFVDRVTPGIESVVRFALVAAASQRGPAA